MILSGRNRRIHCALNCRDIPSTKLVSRAANDLLRDSLCMVARQYNHQATLYGTSTIHRQNKLLYKAYGEVKADSFAVNV